MRKAVIVLMLGLGLLASCKKDECIKPIRIKKEDICMGCMPHGTGIDTTKYTKGF